MAILVSANPALYAATLSSFVKVASDGDQKAHDFAPYALAAYLAGQKRHEDILNDLCGHKDDKTRVLYRSPKGKATQASLPTAVDRAYGKIKALIGYCDKAPEHGGDVSKALVKAWCGYVTNEQRDDCEANYAMWLEEKGLEDTARRRNDYERNYIALLYPDAPKSFNALVESVKAANLKIAAAEAAREAAAIAATNPEPSEGEGQSPAPLSDNAETESGILAKALALIESMNGDEVRAADDELNALIKALGAAFARSNVGEEQAIAA